MVGYSLLFFELLCSKYGLFEVQLSPKKRKKNHVALSQKPNYYLIILKLISQCLLDVSSTWLKKIGLSQFCSNLIKDRILILRQNKMKNIMRMYMWIQNIMWMYMWIQNIMSMYMWIQNIMWMYICGYKT